jgi:hypothetical protein
MDKTQAVLVRFHRRIQKGRIVRVQPHYRPRPHQRR